MGLGKTLYLLIAIAGGVGMCTVGFINHASKSLPQYFTSQ